MCFWDKKKREAFVLRASRVSAEKEGNSIRQLSIYFPSVYGGASLLKNHFQAVLCAFYVLFHTSLSFF